MMTDFMRRRLAIKNGTVSKQGAKPPAPIKKISDKKQAEIAEAKALQGEEDSVKEQWFQARRREMTGVCQCGCASKSSKHEDQHFRSSIAHIFPQRLFPSVQFHPLNWVERNFWDGHHTNMDNRSMNLWVNFADWDDIKAKFHQLSKLITKDERVTKFYTQLEKLVNEN